jgi:hypothetical protein
MFDGDEKYKMYYAFNMILVKSKDNQRYKPTSRFYERARHLAGKTASKLNKGNCLYEVYHERKKLKMW